MCVGGWVGGGGGLMQTEQDHFCRAFLAYDHLHKLYDYVGLIL